MDFHCMKRKQLQALCKKHKIPANLSNLEMANRLSEFLQDGDNPVVKEDVSEIESVDEVENRNGKKVRFSPDHELFEYTRSPEIIKRRSRRNFVSRVESNWSVEIIESGDMNKETVGSTQTGELKLIEAEVKQNKRGRKAVKCNNGHKVVSAVDSCEDGELKEADVVRPGRVTRLRGKMAAEGVNNASKRVRKGAKGNDKKAEKGSDNVKIDEHQEEIVDNHTRVTRSRAQKVTEAPAAEEKRGRKGVKNKVVAVRAQTGNNKESTSGSLSNKGDEGEGKSATISDERTIRNEKGSKEISVNKQIAGEHVIVEPQLLLRRSKRKASGVSESEKFPIDSRRHEDDEVKGSRKTSKVLASDVSKVDIEIIGVNVNPGTKAVLKIEEPIQKMEPRRSNRRKTMIEPDNLRGDTLRSSLPQSDVVPEFSKDEKLVIQPIGVVRRSRRKTLSQKLVSASDTASAVENLDAEKHVSELCLLEKENLAVQKNMLSIRNTSKCKSPGSQVKVGADSKIHQEKKVTKRKRGHVTGDLIKNNNDLNYGAESLKGSSSEKVVSAAVTGKYADERNQPHRVDSPILLDASSHHHSSGIGELLFLDVQRSDSKDSECANSLCSKNINSDVDLTPILETHKKKEEVSVADSSCMNLGNAEGLGNSDTKAASKSAELGTVSLFSEDKKSTSSTMEVEKGKLLVDFDVQELIEQNITDVEKNESEAKVYSQTDDSGCNDKTNDQVLAEGLNVSGVEGSAEIQSSADSFLLGDQTDVNTDLEVVENEVDECAQPYLGLVDQHNEDHLGASSNIPDKDNEDTSQISGDDVAFESCGTDHTHSKSTSKLKPPSSGMTRHHDDCSKNRASGLAEDDDSGCSKDQRNASDNFSELKMPDLSDGQRDGSTVSPDGGIFQDKYSLMNPDEYCKDSEAVATTVICTDSTSVNPRICHEDVRMTNKEERCIYAGINLDGAETRESKSSRCHKRTCDEDGEFSLAKLFDEDGITPKEKENFYGEHSFEDFNEQGMSHGSPSRAATTLCNSTDLSDEGGKAYDFKNKQSESTEGDESGCLKSHKSSNSQETNPSTPSSVSESQENRKSLLAKSNALGNVNQSQGAWSNASELAGNAVCSMKNFEGKIIQVAERLIADEDVNHANYSIDEEVSAEANISDVESCPVGEIAAESLDDVMFQDTVGTEHQHRNLVATQTESDAGEEAAVAISRQSWTEAELQNLFGSSDEDAPPGPNDTFCQGSETANITMSKNKSTASNSGILAKEQEKEMEGESRIESDAEIYENEFKLLFATPVKITTPCNTEEIYSHGRVLEGSVASIKICSKAMKETVATRSKSNDKVHNAGYEIENTLRIGALSDNGGGVTYEGLNEVQSFELVTASTRVLSGSESDGCEALEDQLTQNKEECLQETNSLTEEDREEHVPLLESCLNGEEELGSCAHMSERHSCKRKTHTCQTNSAGEMKQSTIAELSDADLQKSDVPEKSHLFTASSNDGDILSEISIENSSDPEVAKIGSDKEDLTEKGKSPFLLKASLDYEESNSDTHHEAKKLDEKDGNSKSSEDISDELHTNREVAIQEIVANCNNMSQGLDQLARSDELESTCKEAKVMEMTTQMLYNTDAAAEHGSFVYGEVSGVSNSEMHLSLEYHGNGDKKLEAGEPVQDAGFELGDLLSDGGDGTCGEMNDVETGGFKISSTTVLSKTEFAGCGASEEQFTENTVECQEGTSFITEDNEEKVTPLGQSCLYDEETDNDCESTEADINSLLGTPNNLDKLGGCQDMLIDTALSRSFSCKSRVDKKSEQEMTQSNEAAVDLSDADLQNSYISKNSQNITDEGIYLLPSSKASPVDDELTQSTDTDDLNGAEICDEILDTKEKSSQDMPSESYINSEVAILKILPDSNNQSEEAGLPCGLERTFLDTKETDTTTEDPSNIVVTTDHSSSVCGAEMHPHLRDENNDIENLDVGKPVFNLSIDNDKEDSEKAEENSTALKTMDQFRRIQELHFEENVQDFKNDTHTIPNLPASVYNEILRESDVDDTIKEYIDSESSLPMIFDNSGASLPSDMLADADERIATENSAPSAYKKDIADCQTPRMKISCHSSSKDEDIVPSVDCLDTEIKEEEEATLLTRPAQVSLDAADSPECVDEGTAIKFESQKETEQENDQSPSRSMVRKNARSILIHGTPRKFHAVADMKENVPNQKRSNIAHITAMRSAKRRPLGNLQL